MLAAAIGALLCAQAQAAEPRVAAWSEGGVIRAELEADVSPAAAALWPALSAYAAQHTWVPYMRKATLEQVEAGVALCAGLTDLPWPLKDRTWTIQMRAEESEVLGLRVYVASWEYVPESGNLNDTRGAWSLTELADGGTRVHLEASADIGDTVPATLLRWVERNALPSMLDALLAQAGEDAK